MSRDILDRHRSLRILIGLLCVAVGIYIVSAVWSVVVVLSNVILLFLLAWIISFVLDPVAILLRQRGLPRVAAVSLIYFALLIVVSGAIVLAVPSIEGQIKLLSTEITSTFSATNLPILSKNAEEILRHMGFSQRDAHNIVSQLSAQLPNWTSQLTNGAVTMATTAVASLLTIVVDTLLIVILSYYIMLDGTRLVEAGIAKLPPSWVGDVRLFQRYARDIFGGFFRAQLIVAAIYALATWIILLTLGQSNGLLVSLISGALMLLPFIGAVLAVVPPALLVLLQESPDQIVIKLIVLLIALVLAQQLVLNLIAPRIFGKHMGVPTLILFAALLIGIHQGGVWGAFFAGPLVAIAYAMFEVFYARLAANSALFQAANAAGEQGAAAAPAHDAAPQSASPAEQRPAAGGEIGRRDTPREPVGGATGAPGSR